MDDNTQVTLIPAVEPALENNTGSLSSTGRFMNPTARSGDTDITTVSRPYVITVSYTPTDIFGIDESSLGIYWWNGTAWVKEAGSTVDTAARTVSAAINHLSSFALLGESSVRRIYLPLVVRGANGW